MGATERFARSSYTAALRPNAFTRGLSDKPFFCCFHQREVIAAETTKHCCTYRPRQLFPKQNRQRGNGTKPRDQPRRLPTNCATRRRQKVRQHVPQRPRLNCRDTPPTLRDANPGNYSHTNPLCSQGLYRDLKATYVYRA